MGWIAGLHDASGNIMYVLEEWKHTGNRGQARGEKIGEQQTKGIDSRRSRCECVLLLLYIHFRFASRDAGRVVASQDVLVVLLQTYSLARRRRCAPCPLGRNCVFEIVCVCVLLLRRSSIKMHQK